MWIKPHIVTLIFQNELQKFHQFHLHDGEVVGCKIFPLLLSNQIHQYQILAAGFLEGFTFILLRSIFGLSLHLFHLQLLVGRAFQQLFVFYVLVFLRLLPTSHVFEDLGVILDHHERVTFSHIILLLLLAPKNLLNRLYGLKRIRFKARDS